MPAMDFRDCYWTVGGDTGKVYSSKRNVYVDPADDAYEAWVAAFERTGNLADESEIWFYVKEFQPLWLWDGTNVSQPAEGQYRKSQLHNYNGLVRATKVDGGMVAQGVPVKTDDRSRGLMQGARAASVDNKQFATKWYGADGNFYDVDADKMIAMADEVGAHTNDCYAVFQETHAAIEAGSITKPDQIDAAYEDL